MWNTIKNIGIALAVILSALKLYDWTFPNEPSISAIVTQCGFDLPPPLESCRDPGVPAVTKKISGYYDIEITNDGNKKIANLIVTVPHGTYAVYQRDGEALVETEIEGRIKLTELMPRESVHVKAWSYMSPGVWSEARLTHDDGVGDVRTLRMQNRYEIPRSVECVLSFIAGCVLATYLIVKVVAGKEKSKEERTNEHNDVEGVVEDALGDGAVDNNTP